MVSSPTDSAGDTDFAASLVSTALCSDLCLAPGYKQGLLQGLYALNAL